MSTAIEITQEEGFVLARLNRPTVRNAIDEQMVAELHELCAQLEQEPQILIITGCTVETSKGPRGIFASGADIAQLRERRRDDAHHDIGAADAGHGGAHASGLPAAARHNAKTPGEPGVSKLLGYLDSNQEQLRAAWPVRAKPRIGGVPRNFLVRSY